MTGKQKIEAAFSIDGTPEIPAVICYEGIYIRDHWDQITSCPWWYQYEMDIERQIIWHEEVISNIGKDWFALPSSYSKNYRMNHFIDKCKDGVYIVNKETGQKRKLEKPKVAGWSGSSQLHSVKPKRLVDTFSEIDVIIPIPSGLPPKTIEDGSNDLANRLLEKGLYPICHVGSPLWSTYSLWGFEGMMTMIADHPDLVKHACERFLVRGIYSIHYAAILGASGIWIEDCMTDMISPEAFAQLNVPYIRSLVEAIRNAGMKSIYYFCGNPAGKWEHLIDTGADALSLEESKKGFKIDIEEIVEKVKGRCAVLGNLDAINLLPNASEDELRKEISRQIASGRKNNSKFIMSLGSPVTPGTSVERVRLYCDLAHELGSF